MYHFIADQPPVPLVLTDSNGRERSHVQVPGHICQYLKSFQLDAIRFLYSQWVNNDFSILNDESGLGKSVTIVVFLNAIAKNKKCLIVVPNDEELIAGWQFHFSILTSLSVNVLDDNGCVDGKDSIDDSHHNIYITKWSALKSAHDNLNKFNFDLIIIDNRNQMLDNHFCTSMILRLYEKKINILMSSSDVTSNVTLLHNILKMGGRLEHQYENLNVFQNKFQLPNSKDVLRKNLNLEEYFLKREILNDFCKEFRLRRYHHQYEDLMPLVETERFKINLELWRTDVNKKITLEKSTISSSKNQNHNRVMFPSDKETQELFEHAAAAALNAEITQITQSAEETGNFKHNTYDIVDIIDEPSDMSPLLFISDSENEEEDNVEINKCGKENKEQEEVKPIEEEDGDNMQSRSKNSDIYEFVELSSESLDNNCSISKFQPKPIKSIEQNTNAKRNSTGENFQKTSEPYQLSAEKNTKKKLKRKCQKVTNISNSNDSNCQIELVVERKSSSKINNQMKSSKDDVNHDNDEKIHHTNIIPKKRTLRTTINNRNGQNENEFNKKAKSVPQSTSGKKLSQEINKKKYIKENEDCANLNSKNTTSTKKTKKTHSPEDNVNKETSIKDRTLKSNQRIYAKEATKPSAKKQENKNIKTRSRKLAIEFKATRSMNRLTRSSQYKHKLLSIPDADEVKKRLKKKCTKNLVNNLSKKTVILHKKQNENIKNIGEKVNLKTVDCNEKLKDQNSKKPQATAGYRNKNSTKITTTNTKSTQQAIISMSDCEDENEDDMLQCGQKIIFDSSGDSNGQKNSATTMAKTTCAPTMLHNTNNTQYPLLLQSSSVYSTEEVIFIPPRPATYKKNPDIVVVLSSQDEYSSSQSQSSTEQSRRTRSLKNKFVKNNAITLAKVKKVNSNNDGIKIKKIVPTFGQLLPKEKSSISAAPKQAPCKSPDLFSVGSDLGILSCTQPLYNSTKNNNSNTNNADDIPTNRPFEGFKIFGSDVKNMQQQNALSKLNSNKAKCERSCLDILEKMFEPRADSVVQKHKQNIIASKNVPKPQKQQLRINSKSNLRQSAKTPIKILPTLPNGKNAVTDCRVVLKKNFNFKNIKDNECNARDKNCIENENIFEISNNDIFGSMMRINSNGEVSPIQQTQQQQSKMTQNTINQNNKITNYFNGSAAEMNEQNNAINKTPNKRTNNQQQQQHLSGIKKSPKSPKSLLTSSSGTKLTKWLRKHDSSASLEASTSSATKPKTSTKTTTTPTKTSDKSLKISTRLSTIKRRRLDLSSKT